ncbi:Deoxycytidine triphosphate deaminase [Nitrosomonas ureae]|uniref:Deoxycytidine triphosphate deaminase n=1 Tax=Nitrosomonas ureae TaxID=44577 RepID=A0A285BV67_9PROT|nr:dUTP pyrophosphatase [Nitrosomonas ureae]SNX58743.1 Deoxycytidine triphosphate deaminase [Nitrosomonas ureae]
MTVLQIKDRTTSCQEDFNEYALSSNSFIFTTASESNIEEFSIELTLGEGWNDKYSPFDKKLSRISDDGITIPGHGSIVVEVHDEIRVPHNRYGIVLPTGSLFLSRGILIASAKVEPAFVGKLKLRMFNTTSKRISLKKGEKVGSIIFFSTESTKIQNFIYRTSEISTTPMSRSAGLKKWLASNKPLWIGWIITVISSSSLAFVLTYTLFYKPMLEMNKFSLEQKQQYPQEQNIEMNNPSPEQMKQNLQEQNG